MTHWDDKGLRLPSHIAPIQVFIVFFCARQRFVTCVFGGGLIMTHGMTKAFGCPPT
jgi:hypothetical protein